MSPAGSSRWSPTQEQLMILEEMYRGGTRTPNASQIQHITAHLSFYGKIEGKNVFYWFQNHKARDRQKLRRKLNKQLQLQQQQLYYQVQQNQNYNHHFVESLSVYSTQQLSSSNSVASFSKGGPGGASKHGINYTWTVDNPEGEMKKTVMNNYKEDWRMMMEVDAASSYSPRVPLKTLELFPVRDRLKEECSKSKPLSETH